MDDRSRCIAGPCPVCGTPGSATMSSSAWGHAQACCSDRCGFLYATSDARTRDREARLVAEIAALRRELRLVRAPGHNPFARAAGHVLRAQHYEHEASWRLTREKTVRGQQERDESIARKDQARANGAWVEAAVALLAEVSRDDA